MSQYCSGCKVVDDAPKVLLSCEHYVHKGLNVRVLELNGRRQFFQLGNEFACATLFNQSSPMVSQLEEDPRGSLTCPSCGHFLNHIECCQVLDRDPYLSYGAERSTSLLVKSAIAKLAEAWCPQHVNNFVEETLNKSLSEDSALSFGSLSPNAKLTGLQKMIELIKFYQQNPNPKRGDILTEAVLEADLRESDQEKAFSMINVLVEGGDPFEQEKATNTKRSGTGYGGDEHFVLESAAKEREMIHKKQLETDEAVRVAIMGLKEAIDACGNRLGAATEAIMRKEWGPMSCLLEYLGNGHFQDILVREAVYSSVLMLCESIANNPMLVPLLLSSKPLRKNGIKWSAEAAIALARQTASKASPTQQQYMELEGPPLAESIQALHSLLDANAGQSEATIQVLCQRVLSRIEETRAGNPHFANQDGEESAKLANAIRLCNTAGTKASDKKLLYKKHMNRFAFRMVDMTAAEIKFSLLAKSDERLGSSPDSAAPKSTSTTAATSANNRERMVAIKNTLAALKSSCAVDWESSVFCLVDEQHADRLSFLITGPDGTPYQNGCFHFEMYLPASFPRDPPKAIFLTTGGGKVRFNPNLYADGKICLSLLGTWKGPNWNEKESTVLQVLLSIQSLILCAEPYFNEPGYEAAQGTPSGEMESKKYNSSIRIQTIRLAMAGMLESPPKGFEDVIRHHFAFKSAEIIDQCEAWIKDANGQSAGELTIQITALRKLLEKNVEELKQSLGS